MHGSIQNLNVGCCLETEQGECQFNGTGRSSFCIDSRPEFRGNFVFIFLGMRRRFVQGHSKLCINRVKYWVSGVFQFARIGINLSKVVDQGHWQQQSSLPSIVPNH